MSFANPCGPSSDQPWKRERAWITTLYEPAFSVFTALPFSFRLIVYPGPSVPVSTGVADCLAAAPAKSTAPTTRAVNKRIRAFRMQTLLRMRSRRRELRILGGAGFRLGSAARGVAQPG